MQRPVGSDVVNGRAELTSIGDLLTNRLALVAYTHVILVGLTTACVVVFGVACWHLLRGRNGDLFMRAAKLALIVGVRCPPSTSGSAATSGSSSPTTSR